MYTDEQKKGLNEKMKYFLVKRIMNDNFETVFQ